MLESLRSFLSGKTLLIFVTIMAIPFVFLGSSAVGTIFTTYGKVNGLEVTQTDLNAANNTVNQRLLEVYGEEFSLDIIPEDALLGMVKEEIISQKTLLDLFYILLNIYYYLYQLHERVFYRQKLPIY